MATEDPRWELERDIKQREIALAERRLDHEIAITSKASTGSGRDWKNPVVVAILAAAVAAGGNAAVSVVQGHQSRVLEAEKAESGRILKMIETGDPDKAAENLAFLLDAGLISDRSVAAKLERFLENRQPGDGPSLSSPGAVFSSPQVASIQEAKSDCGLIADGVAGPMTMACVSDFLGGASRDEVRRLLSESPDQLNAWLAEGRAPDDWRAVLMPSAAASLQDAPVEAVDPVVSGPRDFGLIFIGFSGPESAPGVAELRSVMEAAGYGPEEADDVLEEGEDAFIADGIEEDWAREKADSLRAAGLIVEVVRTREPE